MVQLLGNSLATGPEQELVRFSRPGKDIAESSGQSDRVRGSTSIEIGTLKTDVGGAAHPSQALEPQTTQSSHDQIIEIHDQEDNTGHQRNQILPVIQTDPDLSSGLAPIWDCKHTHNEARLNEWLWQNRNDPPHRCIYCGAEITINKVPVKPPSVRPPGLLPSPRPIQEVIRTRRPRFESPEDEDMACCLPCIKIWSFPITPWGPTLGHIFLILVAITFVFRLLDHFIPIHH
ncbi:hypothetical protein PSTG_07217 [Puccinia striiformis f. sp. tritici PST-78]|uniref:Uncharacterized protein n=1 Tax=Puccinia striiformis f. sp. tritici PST-78 TaxID=1165861 RepID=A0A0L0VJQ9_9BASI|nr:hypothetical protein PSTG_07217 [Puccinia striiformis f. sp. tritici PST-78]